ncbi:Predicted glycosyltransferase [Plasmopara halstedii]|uniref:UDP-N-acetylglucosamine transferase subunit ALG14 n=1 Tax=Plasmopara halstedii TaxID=4781 RepID=A0A0P1B6H2_PLAHL|nr:Predicted glycosyltransferase [Plasmopara halstedii]CEG49672.1 Predicted glycosyltransferase [Plasmopara halstedii]|eukprot:XP_024586041.1 Predicted glycosyltransferase [Plasmopara halstedii]
MELLLRVEGVLVLVTLFLVFRIWHVIIPKRMKVSSSSYFKSNFHQVNADRGKNRQQIRVMAVLGSGGHTTELLKLMKRLHRDIYTPVTFVIAETDKTSQTKTELDWKPKDCDSFAFIPRSREVEFMIIILNGILTMWLISRRPQLVLCNGPGTCIPICIAVVLFRVLGIHTDSKIIFCESFARVQHLSLTGKMLYYVADEFVVQWPQLQVKYPRTKHLGVIC